MGLHWFCRMSSQGKEGVDKEEGNEGGAHKVAPQLLHPLHLHNLSLFSSSLPRVPFSFPFFPSPYQRTETDLAVVVNVGVEHLRHKSHRRSLWREKERREKGRKGIMTGPDV